jgi:hypothetical protein
MMSSIGLSLLLLSLWIPHSAASATSATPSPNNIITYPLVSHHVRRERALKERQLVNDSLEDDEHQFRRRDAAQQVGALYQGYGTHYIDLWCGSPPQRQTVIVDTGSGITAFPCGDCKNCGVPDYHTDKLFVETDSSSFSRSTCETGGNSCTSQRAKCKQDGTCTISMSYAEGSRWDAYESTDLCYVGGPHDAPLLVDDGKKEDDDIDPQHASHLAFNLVFGCQTLVTGLFKTQLADGIMGMNKKNEAFWYQMFDAGKLGPDKQFALCFSRQPIAQRKGTEAGALTLGGVDPRLHLSDMVYTGNASGGRAGFFSVQVRKVYLREGKYGESVKSTSHNQKDGIRDLGVSFDALNQGGIIVDSGTTDSYWNSKISTAFQKVFKEMSGRSYGHSALTLTTKELAQFPTILFQLVAGTADNVDNPVGLAGALDSKHPKDVIIAFPPTHYMEYDADKGKWTARFYVTESKGSVLGANAMMGHDVLFDVDKDRIGWAESNCDYTKLVTENGYDFQGKSGEDDDESTSEDDDGSTSEDDDESTSEDDDGSTSEDDGDDDDQSKPDKTKEKAKHGEYDFGKGIKAFAGACDSLECRGSIAAGLLMTLCLSFCIARCFCTGSRPDPGYRIALTKSSEEEIELSNGNGGKFSSSYKDEPENVPDDEQPSSNEAEFEGDYI